MAHFRGHLITEGHVARDPNACASHFEDELNGEAVRQTRRDTAIGQRGGDTSAELARRLGQSSDGHRCLTDGGQQPRGACGRVRLSEPGQGAEQPP